MRWDRAGDWHEQRLWWEAVFGRRSILLFGVVTGGGAAFMLLSLLLSSTEPMAHDRPAQPRAPRIRLAQADTIDFRAADVKGQSGQPVALRIESSPDASEDDLFTVQGLPSDINLTAGTRYNNFWVIKRADLQSLAIAAPEDFSGTFQISITRARTLQRAPQTLTINVSLSKSSAAAEPQSSSSPERTAAITIQRLAPDEKILLDKAYAAFRNGDVAGARATFEYLAMKGRAAGAVAMAETYDPAVLGKLYVRGLKADIAKAQEWYRKAEQLGDPEARARLSGLEPR